MKVIVYNVTKTARVKTMVVTALSLFVGLSSYAVFNRSWEIIRPVNYWQIGIIVVVMLFYYAIHALIDFEHVLEVKDRNTFVTYLRAGFITFSRKIYHGPVDVVLEQDKKRYFCITLKRHGNEDFIADRIPTLKQANNRLDEIKLLFQ